MSTGHARFSPSGYHRWSACPGSIALLEALNLPRQSSRYAAEGTTAHEIAAECLTLGREARYYEGHRYTTEGFDFTIDEDFCTAVQSYLDYVRTFDGARLVEQRVPLTPLTGEVKAYGTADAIIFGPDRWMVIDLKFGAGVRVHAERNGQLMMYAAAALFQYAAVLEPGTRITLAVHQPRLDHIDEWETSIDELAAFIDTVDTAVLRARQPDAPLIPGADQCKFCDAKAHCPALAAWVEEQTAMNFDDLAALDFDDLDTPATPATLFIDQLAEALRAVPLIEDWCKAIRSRVESELLNGQPVPGFKLVQGRQGPRKWEDDAPLLQLFEAAHIPMRDCTKVEFISPTQTEKLFKRNPVWETFQPYIIQAPGTPSVAPDTDPRPSIQITSTPQ